MLLQRDFSSTVDFIRLLAFDWTSKNVTSLINPLYAGPNRANNDRFDNIVRRNSLIDIDHSFCCRTGR